MLGVQLSVSYCTSDSWPNRVTSPVGHSDVGGGILAAIAEGRKPAHVKLRKRKSRSLAMWRSCILHCHEPGLEQASRLPVVVSGRRSHIRGCEWAKLGKSLEGCQHPRKKKTNYQRKLIESWEMTCNQV